MKFSIRAILVLLAVALYCIALSVSANAAIIYVNQNAGGTTHNGSSWATAYLTIDSAMTPAASGDEIWVAAATYAEMITLKDGVQLYGGFVGTETVRNQRNWRTHVTTINGSQGGTVVTVPGGGVLDGFTIINGRAGEGSGVYCTGTGAPTITNNIITQNICTTIGAVAGGIYCAAGSQATITNNKITNNGSYGAGMAGSSPVTISNNWISGNTGGILCWYPMNASAKIVGNTIVDNSNASGIFCSHQPFTIANNIVAYCETTAIYVMGSGGAPTVQNNCLYGNSGDYYGISPGTGDIYDDPAFVNRSTGDYHITGSSSCLNAGSNSVSGVTSVDIDGEARIYDTTIDIGSDEFSSPFIHKPIISPGGGTYNQTQSVTVTCDTAGAVIHYTTNGSDPTEASPTIASGGTVSVTTSLTLKVKAFKTGLPTSATTTGIYTLVALTPTFSPDGYVGDVNPQTVTISCASTGCTIRYTTNGVDPTTSDPTIASGGTISISQSTVLKAKAFRTGWTSSDVKTAVYRFGHRLHVWNSSPGPAHNGFTWQTAFMSVSDALVGAVSGDEIWVAQGTYVENIAMKDGVSLYGGFVGTETALSTRNWTANETILDGNQVDNVVLVPAGVTTSARIDGFTIRNGKTPAMSTHGGGITCASGSIVIANNKITGNTATGNGWVVGGGINFYGSNSVLINNIITGNTANYGGGFCTSSSTNLTVVNNTIVGNTAVNEGGGLYWASTSGTMENNIIAFNSSGIYKGTSYPPTFDYNCVYSNTAYNYSGVTASAHDISVDPLFVNRTGGDYHLLSSSPCRDVGLSAAPSMPSMDLDGQSRIGNTAVDIGVDEYWPMVATPTLTPDGGTYDTTQSVVVNCATDMAMMYYTTNGNIPTESDSPVAEGGTIAVNVSTILRVRAFKSGLRPSYIKTGVYNLTAATPTFNPDGGTFNTTKSVMVRCTSPGVTIHYTTNGLDPTESDLTVATGTTLTISQSLTLKAKAFRTGWTPSATKSADFTLAAATPTFSPDGGTYAAGQNVTVSCTSPDVTIHYTTNGVDPTESDPTVASGGTVLVEYSLTLKAKAFRSNWTASSVKSASYTITTVTTPQFNPDGGISNTRIDVTVTCVTPGATIRYTTNGADPTASSPIVASGGVISVDSSLTLKAKAFKTGLADSAVKSASYTITNILYVDVSAPGPNYDGFTWQTAYTAVEDALKAALKGNEIWVADGDYFYYDSLMLTEDIGLYGGFSGVETARSQRNWVVNIARLRPKTAVSAVMFAKEVKPTTVIDGFTIMDGNAVEGGGICCQDASPTIANNIIKGNCASGDGGGIYVAGNSAPVICNNLILANTSGHGGGGICCIESAPLVANNTIVDNIAVNGGAIACVGDSSSIVANNIIAYNDSGIFCDGHMPEPLANYVGQNVNYDYLGLDPGRTDITGHDPGFLDYGAGDYHLISTSLCVDNGDDSIVMPEWVDMDGKARTSGSRVDIGAYECGPVPTPQFNPDGGISNHSINVVVTCSLAGATIHYTTNGVDPTESDPIVVSGGSAAISSTATLKATAFKPGWLPSEVKSALYMVTNVVYVWQSAPGPVHDGLTWQSACLSVSDGMHVAVTCNEVWVAEGLYLECVEIPAGIALYGGFAGNEMAREKRDWNMNTTILDGNGEKSVIRIDAGATSTTVIDGFTIQNGMAEIGGGIYCAEASPSIFNNVIKDNNASERGGGIFCGASDAVIKNNIFMHNYSPVGSAIGCENDSRASIVNNTIFENGNSSGGVVSALTSALPELVNNIVVYNSSGLYCDGGGMKLYTNCVYHNDNYNYQGITPGPTDISLNASFVDQSSYNLHLQPDSPCIDAGTNRHVPITDLDGAIRPQDGNMDLSALWDIGAYEYPLNLFDAKRDYPNGSAIAFGSTPVTAQFLGQLYVERLDRTVGIRVDTADTFAIGSLVNVSGFIQTDSTTGERYIAATAPWPEPMAGRYVIEPLGFTNKNLGGGGCGIQEGIFGGRGLNNIGLLAVTFGAVVEVDSGTPRTWFKIDDGSGVQVKVIVPTGVNINPAWQYAVVRGISSCEKVGGNLYRVIKVRITTDIEAF